MLLWEIEKSMHIKFNQSKIKQRKFDATKIKLYKTQPIENTTLVY